ncbi:MAG: hypothetical protein HY814_07445 [Candidatus Riflebacteria bacterium]|nr:hypothetical protein [Candidatus Riflebacteria bacterium]
MALATAGFAGGIPFPGTTGYLSRSSAAVDDGLAKRDLSLADEFASLLEAGAYDKLPVLRTGMTNRVLRSLASRSPALQGTGDGARTPLAALTERIRKASAARPRVQAVQPLTLPADEGAHLRLAEWWYLNGHLQDDAGRPYGYELCFFHVRPGIAFAHIAVTDVEGRRFHRLRKYFSPFQCRIPRDKLELAYGDKQSLSRIGDFLYRARGDTGDAALDLQLQLVKQPMMVNGNGLIDMPEGTFSYYYSLTRLQTEGHLVLDGKRFRVAGVSWMDHQWGNFVTIGVGWDWFAVQLRDGSDLNIFSFRQGKRQKAQFINRTEASGQLTSWRSIGIERLAFWKSPVTGYRYVTHFRLKLPDGRPLEIRARLDDQEMPGHALDPAPTYWEGKCVARLGGKPEVMGLSYCEQFPYP